MFQPPEKMTVEQLAWRVEWHKSFARMFRTFRQEKTADEFAAMAKPYERELQRRQLHEA